MTTTSNAQAVKAGLITTLAALTDPSEALDGVQVTYSAPSKIERATIYGGRIDVDQTIVSGRASGSTTREERATILLHVRVYRVGGTPAEAEAAAVAIAAVVEDYLATTTPSVTGLLNAEVTGWALDSDEDDDGALAVATLQVRTESHIA